MVNQVEYKKIFSKNGGITIKYYLKLLKKIIQNYILIVQIASLQFHEQLDLKYSRNKSIR